MLQRMLEDVFKSSPIIMIVLDIQKGTILEVNDAFGNHLHFHREEIIGKPIKKFKLISSDKMKSLFAQIREKGYLRNQLEIVQDKLGQPHICMVSADMFKSENQFYIFANIDDITNRIQHNDYANVFSSQIRQLLDYLPCVAWMKDAQGRYLAVNKMFATEHNGNENQFIGYKADEIFSNDLSTAFSLDDDMVIKTKEVLRIEQKMDSGNYYETYKKSVWDSAGNLIGTAGIALNITEQKQIEQALKDSEFKFRIMTEYSLDWRYWVAPDGVSLVTTSPSCLRVTGYTRDEFLNNPELRFQIVHPEDAKKYEEERNLFVQNASPLPSDDLVRETEFRIITKDGEIKRIYHICHMIYTPENEFLGYIVSSRDITLREKSEQIEREYQQAKEMAHLRSEFLANVSHEMRTPLTIILSSLQLLQQYVKSPKILEKNYEKFEKYNQYIRQNTYRMLKLVNNLIDITKIDAGFFALKRQHCDIVTFVRDIAESVRPRIESKQIAFSFSSNVKHKTISCDTDQVERIMLNLLSNAAKFTPCKEKISVEVQAHPDEVLILVKDTGEGIPEDRIPKLFERFQQGHTDILRRMHEGSGIGLSLVKSLVDMHGGRIEVVSRQGEGSCFTVSLPIKNSIPPNNLPLRESPPDVRVHKIEVEFSDIYM